MSIKSYAFGRVVLTDGDAEKFRAQVTYGRPKEAAKRNVIEGIKISKDLERSGSISLRLNDPA